MHLLENASILRHIYACLYEVHVFLIHKLRHDVELTRILQLQRYRVLRTFLTNYSLVFHIEIIITIHYYCGQG